MAIALIINTCVYIAVIHTLCQSKRQVSKMLGNLTSQKNRSENAEKYEVSFDKYSYQLKINEQHTMLAIKELKFFPGF